MKSEEMFFVKKSDGMSDRLKKFAFAVRLRALLDRICAKCAHSQPCFGLKRSEKASPEMYFTKSS